MSSNSTFDALIREHISHEVAEQLPAELAKRLEVVRPLTVWMTETQLAEYWQLRNKEGELTVHSIRTWTARPKGEHPLPCANMGDMRRYHREEVDRWAREEHERQREKNSKRKGGYLQAVESQAG